MAPPLPPPASAPTPSTAKSASLGKRIALFIKKYYKALIVVLTPLIFLPIPVLDPRPQHFCLYVILIMAILWMTEAIPLPVTAMIPIVLFPVMGILDSDKTTAAYMKDVNMMFLGGLMLAAGVQVSKLPTRVAIKTVQIVGTSHRRLILGLSLVTMLISMWVSNSATVVIMVPIVEAVLDVLEKQGLGDVYIDGTEDSPIPTDTTVCYYLMVAYSASIGGLGTIVGTGPNGAFKGIYESEFKDLPPVNFVAWMLYSVPAMLVMEVVTWLLLQVTFMGMFRPNSATAKNLNRPEARNAARVVINEHYKMLGPITWHEMIAGLLFLLAVCLWVTRDPGTFLGWAKLCSDLKTGDSVVSMLVVILMFVFPMSLGCLIFCKRNKTIDELEAVKKSSGVITWTVLAQKVPWGLMFLLGGGFALAEGSKASGLSKMLGQSLNGLNIYPKWAILLIAVTACECLTEFTSNVAIASLILPVLGQLARAVEVHPFYLMLPATFACSMSTMMPVGTPPNAIVAGVANIPTKKMVIGGFLPKIVTIIVIWGSMCTWGNVIYPEIMKPFFHQPPPIP